MLLIKKYKIKDAQLKGLRIVFAGDYHIKVCQKKKLQNLIKKINSFNPDIFLSVGDYINGHKLEKSLDLEIIGKEFSNINTKYGKFSVIGNHDWRANEKKVIEVLSKNGFTFLQNRNVKIEINDKTLFIAGVEDMQRGSTNIQKALENTTPPTILLSHSPDIFPEVPEYVSLTLAGHLHGGQIRLPFIGGIIIPSKFGNKYANGLTEENGRKILTTKGIGTSLFQIRFNCPPEIHIIDFI